MIRVLNALMDIRYGGPQKRVIDVSVGLLSQGIETTILFPVGEGSAAAIAEKNGLKVICLPFSKMPKPKEILKVVRWVLFLPKDIYLIANAIKANQIDMVHVNGAYFLAPAFAAKVTSRALVWHLNDTFAPRGLARVLGMLVKWLADEVVVAADAVAHHYRIGVSPYSVIFAPVDVARVARKQTYACAQGLKRVGLVANWNPAKGLEVFVEASALVNTQGGDDTEFVIAGSKLVSQAKYASDIEQLISDKGLHNRVQSVGFVDDMASFLQGLNVLVLASWSEACPMAVLEAMATGVPVVATDVGGVKELLRPDTEDAAGFVVPAGDAVLMAERVVVLLNNENLCEEMGNRGRFLAENVFSIEACQQKHLDVYQVCSARKHS